MSIFDTILDEELEGEISADIQQEAGEFKVMNDYDANQAVKKVKLLRKNVDRYESVIKQEIENLKLKAAVYRAQAEKTVEFYENCLKIYTMSADCETTKTGNRVYRLPDGKLCIKKQEPEFVRDDAALTEWLKAHGGKFIKTTASPEWGEFKKVCKTQGEVLVDENGEIVDGVKVIPREERFVIE
jgi:hypothetical protein